MGYCAISIQQIVSFSLLIQCKGILYKISVESKVSKYSIILLPPIATSLRNTESNPERARLILSIQITNRTVETLRWRVCLSAVTQPGRVSSAMIGEFIPASCLKEQQRTWHVNVKVISAQHALTGCGGREQLKIKHVCHCQRRTWQLPQLRYTSTTVKFSCALAFSLPGEGFFFCTQSAAKNTPLNY